MRSEVDTPIEQRFLMVLGKLSDHMIRQLEQEQMPFWLERARQRGDKGILAQWERFSNRDRTKDHAFYTLYAYADIPLGRRYDCFFPKHSGPPVPTNCTIEHIIFEGWFPIEEIGHGHKHIVFLRFDGVPSESVPVFADWEEVGQADWQFGLCDQATYDARRSSSELPASGYVRPAAEPER
jgi:hypothetical protein